MRISLHQEDILRYLAEYPGASIKDMSLHLKRTEEDVHYHLKKLIEKGEITSEVSLKTRQGRGRPSTQYRLSMDQQPNNYRYLCNKLLDILNPTNNDESIFIILASQMVSIKEIKPLSKKINSLVRQLNDINYAAYWQAQSDGPHLVFRNCPYRSILSQHPELCSLDRILIEMNIPSKTNILQTIRDLSNICEFQLSV
jgi:DeoR family transcriptional regulator, suf operon transcriptional repressor